MRLLKVMVSSLERGPGSILEKSDCEEKERKLIRQSTPGMARFPRVHFNDIAVHVEMSLLSSWFRRCWRRLMFQIRKRMDKGATEAAPVLFES